MKFSVDQESISDIIFALTSYSDDIDSEFRKFEDEIIKIAIKTNYNKLLYALQGIIDIYNDVICGSMRKQLLAQWIEEGESLHSFAEDVYMGEESEEAVKRIENSLEEIFIGYKTNELFDLDFSGDSNATREDFDDAVRCFESFAQEIDRIRENNSDYFESKTEDNELYRFLIPVIESIAVGVSMFSSAAKTELNRLGDNYVERMDSAKQRVEEAKKEKTPVDFDLDLFDFDDEPLGTGLLPEQKNSVSDNYKENVQSTSSGKTTQKRYDGIIRALVSFDGKSCTYPELRKKYNDHLTNYKKNLDTRVKVEYDKRDKQLKQYHKQLEQQLNNRHKELDGRYIKGTISLQQAEYMYAESCAKADQLYSIKERTLWAEYQNICQQANQMYNTEVARCNQIANKALQNQQSVCRNLYEHKEEYISKLNSGEAEQCVEELRQLVGNINQKCSKKCNHCISIIEALKLSVEAKDEGIIDDLKRELDPLNVNLKGLKRRKDNLSWEDNLRATNPGYYQSAQNKDKKYTHNCQRCVMAYEARCRGFDVTAKERQLSGDTLPNMNDPNGWPSVFEDKDGKTPVPEKLCMQDGKYWSTTQQAIDDIKRKMESYGDGARAIVRIGRFADDLSRIDGHVFIAEQIDGKTVFCDPQSASHKVVDAIINFGNYNNQVGQCKPRTIPVCDPRCLYGDQPAKIGHCANCKKENVNRNSSITTGVSVSPHDIRILRIDNLKMTKRILDCCND